MTILLVLVAAMVVMVMVAAAAAADGSSSFPAGKCVPYTGAHCQGLVKEYFLPDGVTEDAVEATEAVFFNTSAFSPLMTITGVLPLRLRTALSFADMAVDAGYPDTACFISVRVLLCLAYFPPCTTASSTVPQPLQPCNDICDAVNNGCALLYTYGSIDPLNCSALDPFFSSYPLYPLRASNSSTNAATCNAAVPSYYDFARVCMPPVLVSNPRQTACIYGCTVKLVNGAYVKPMWETTDTFSALSFALMVLSIVAWVANRKTKLVWPLTIPFMLFVACAMIHFGYLMRAAGSFREKQGCGAHDNVHVRAHNNAFCFFQYTSLHLGSLLLVFWFAAFAVNLSSLIIFDIKSLDHRRHAFYAVCFGFPLVLWIVPLAAGYSAFSYLFQLCWLKDDPILNGAKHRRIFTGFYFVWVGLAVGASTILLLATVARIAYITFWGNHYSFSPREFFEEQNAMLRRRITAQVRAILLVLLFVITFSVQMVFHYRLVDSAHFSAEESNESLRSAFCASQNDPPSVVGCEPNIPFSQVFIRTIYVASSLNGFLLFFIFASADVYDMLRSFVVTTVLSPFPAAATSVSRTTTSRIGSAATATSAMKNASSSKASEVDMQPIGKKSKLRQKKTEERRKSRTVSSNLAQTITPSSTSSSTSSTTTAATAADDDFPARLAAIKLTIIELIKYTHDTIFSDDDDDDDADADADADDAESDGEDYSSRVLEATRAVVAAVAVVERDGTREAATALQQLVHNLIGLCREWEKRSAARAARKATKGSARANFPPNIDRDFDVNINSLYQNIEDKKDQKKMTTSN